jgi:hypothetical protein
VFSNLGWEGEYLFGVKDEELLTVMRRMCSQAWGLVSARPKGVMAVGSLLDPPSVSYIYGLGRIGMRAEFLALYLPLSP